MATAGSVPTLFVNGTFDMNTGPGRAQKAARTLSRSTTVQVPGTAH